MQTQHHYLDIRLHADDPEVDPAHVVATLYARLHRALVQLQSGNIGVSFPEHDAKRPTLGTCLRLFGPKNALMQLRSLPWLDGMRDYVAVTDMLPIPSDARHRTLRRVQVKSSPERLRRRLMKRHQVTEAQARERIPDRCVQLSNEPFVTLTSGSTGQRFKLFLSLGPQQSEPEDGSFNSYGLSTDATVPWF